MLPLAGRAQVTAGIVPPAEFRDPRFRGRGPRGFALGGVYRELEVQLFAAAVAIDLPVEDRQFAEYGASRYSHPLPGRIDQVADLVDGQALGELAAALERDDQNVAGANVAAVAGDLVTARCQGATFGEGVSGIEQGVAEIVFGHDSRSIGLERELRWVTMLARSGVVAVLGASVAVLDKAMGTEGMAAWRTLPPHPSPLPRGERGQSELISGEWVIEAKVEAEGKTKSKSAKAKAKAKAKDKDKDNGKDVVVGVVHDGDLRQSQSQRQNRSRSRMQSQT